MESTFKFFDQMVDYFLRFDVISFFKQSKSIFNSEKNKFNQNLGKTNKSDFSRMKHFGFKIKKSTIFFQTVSRTGWAAVVKVLEKKIKFLKRI